MEKEPFKYGQCYNIKVAPVTGKTPIWASEYRPSAFVILFNCSNLAVIKIKVAAKRLGNSNFPQHKCADVSSTLDIELRKTEVLRI